VCEPGLDGVLEARLAFCRRDLLLGSTSAITLAISR